MAMDEIMMAVNSDVSVPLNKKIDFYNRFADKSSNTVAAGDSITVSGNGVARVIITGGILGVSVDDGDTNTITWSSFMKMPEYYHDLVSYNGTVYLSLEIPFEKSITVSMTNSSCYVTFLLRE